MIDQFSVTVTSPLRQDVQTSGATWTPSKCRPRFMIIYRPDGDEYRPSSYVRFIDLRPWWLRVVEFPKRCWWRFQEWIERELPREERLDG